MMRSCTIICSHSNSNSKSCVVVAVAAVASPSPSPFPPKIILSLMLLLSLLHFIVSYPCTFVFVVITSPFITFFYSFSVFLLCFLTWIVSFSPSFLVYTLRHVSSRHHRHAYLRYLSLFSSIYNSLLCATPLTGTNHHRHYVRSSSFSLTCSNTHFPTAYNRSNKPNALFIDVKTQIIPVQVQL